MMADIRECEIGEERYPKRMMGVSGMPDTLYYIGDIGICAGETDIIGVIGKRETDTAGINSARKCAAFIAEQGCVVLNGLAVGCDTAAIQGALDAGGKVIAVMPCGLDWMYPVSNRRLAERIVEGGGCLVSEYPTGTEPEKYRFVQRDRIQAALSDKIVVVDCDRGGGTMKTVEYAIKYGKPVGCLTQGIEAGEVNGWDCIAHKFGAEGNSFLIETGRARAITDMNVLMAYLKQPVFRQMSLFEV